MTGTKPLFFIAAFFMLLAACKQEPEEAGSDPHTPQINPFTGVWRILGEEERFREFRIDGTGGDGLTAAAAFGNNFSFLVYAGQDVQTVPQSGVLLTLSGAAADGINLYSFKVNGSRITLSGGGETLTLERVRGSPAVLELYNSFLGEWTADWDLGEHGRSWSWKYRADGTAKTLHHEIKHQFENAYLTRGNVLVLFGDLRFGYNGLPVFAVFTRGGSDKITVTEQQTHISPAVWAYTRVDSAPWL
ncbi:MAG: hypothetical protein LBJ35_02480 [Spirochaetaceae bacterium]|jgi:hypothetical protein|nr:hypothetical protein [Spirochaetaceae bacterium]